MNLVPRITLLGCLLLFSPPAIAGPDLTVEVELVKGAYDPCEIGVKVPVTFYVSVSNIGDEACSDFYSDFWAEFTCEGCIPASGCGQLYEVPIPELEPGGDPYVWTSPTFYITPNVLPYSYLFFIDSVFNLCPEDDEDNNIACAQYIIPPMAEEPDLALESCTWGPDPNDIAKVEFVATVKNVGCVATKETVNVEFYLDRLGDDYDAHVDVFGDTFGLVVSGLEPDESVDVVASIDCPVGPHTGACVANVFDEQAEPDYGNDYEKTDPDQHMCFEATNNPDLKVTEFTAELVGKTPYFSGSMANVGTVDITPEESFKIGIWYTKPGGPDLATCPDTASGEGSVIHFSDGLENDAEPVEFGHSTEPLSNGFYEAWVVLDCDDEIFEMDEKNNRATDDLLIDLEGPDLEFVEAGYELKEVDKGFDVVYSLRVANAGSKPVEGGFDIDIFYDVVEPPTWQEAGLHEGQFQRFELSLPDGGNSPVEFIWSGAPKGLYHTCAVLDITNEIHETDELNNTTCFEVDVPEYIDGLPNLTIKDFKVNATGNTAKVTIVVANTGVKPAVPLRIDFFSDQEGQPILGDHGDFTYELDELAAGAEVTWAFNIENLPDGEYRAYVIVDTDDEVEEAVEGDNLAGPRIYVICSTCDACAEGIYVTKACYCGGETVAYGFCCADEWYAVGCPAGSVDTYEDIYMPEPSVVEFGNGGFGVPGEDCGCRMTPPNPRSTAGVITLLFLSALLFWVLRRAWCDRVSR